MYRTAGGYSAWRLRRYLGDVLAAVAAWYGVSLLRIYVPIPFTRFLLPSDRLSLAHEGVLFVVVLQLLLLYFFGFYERAEPRPRLQIATRLTTVTILHGLILVGYLFLAGNRFPRTTVLLFVGVNLILLILFRFIEQYFYRPRRRRVALVGDGTAAQDLETKVATHHWHGLDVVGFLAIEDHLSRTSHLSVPCLGSISDLKQLIEQDLFDDLILVAKPESWPNQVLAQLTETRSRNLNVLLLPGPFESLIGKMRYRWVSDIPLIEVIGSRDRRLQRPAKRLLDLAVGGLLLLLTLPAILLCFLLIPILSPGPALYRQTRIGRNRSPFTLYKFRTMVNNAEDGRGEVLATANDPRLIPLGGWMRRSRLDELPQLLNVLLGTMSLVGPRPERPGFVEEYLQRIPGYAERFSMLPGLTGLAQVNGDYDSLADNKLRYDMAYLANASLWLDLSILIRTVRTVLTSRGV